MQTVNRFRLFIRINAHGILSVIDSYLFSKLGAPEAPRCQSGLKANRSALLINTGRTDI